MISIKHPNPKTWWELEIRERCISSEHSKKKKLFSSRAHSQEREHSKSLPPLCHHHPPLISLNPTFEERESRSDFSPLVADLRPPTRHATRTDRVAEFFPFGLHFWQSNNVLRIGNLAIDGYSQKSAEKERGTKGRKTVNFRKGGGQVG